MKKIIFPKKAILLFDLILIIGFIFTIIVLKNPEKLSLSRPLLSADEQEIYLLTLDNIYKTRTNNISDEDSIQGSQRNQLYPKTKRSILIIDKTGIDNFEQLSERIISLKKNTTFMSYKTLKDYKFQNEKSHNIWLSKKNEKYEVITIQKDSLDIWRKDFGIYGFFWDEVYAKYEDFLTLVNFSKIGFNVGNTEAFLSYGDYKSGLNGYSCEILFRKIEGKWEIINISITSFS